MPINGPSSYPATIDDFLAHWEEANAANGGEIAVPPLGDEREDLVDYRDELLAARAKVQAALNDVEMGNATLLQQKEAMLEHLNDFNRRVRGLMPDTAFVNALPEAPQLTRSRGPFVDAMDDVFALWEDINASLDPASPFTLSDGYAVATFQTDLGNLNSTYETDNANERALKLAREERNKIQQKIVPLLVGYRKVIEALFAPDSAIVASLPALYPAPGHTPDAVNAQGIWDEGAQAALITYSESSDSDLLEYQLRRSPVSPYNTTEEVVVATNPAEAAREFSTVAGLANPGDTALYRVYVILTTGNEKGSETVSVTRPS